MCRHAGFRWGRWHGGNSLAGQELAAPVLFGRPGLLCEFVWYFLLICIVVVAVPSVLLNCPYPDPPVSACFFFHSPLHCGGGRGGRVVLLLPVAAETKTMILHAHTQIQFLGGRKLPHQKFPLTKPASKFRVYCRSKP